MEKDKYELDYTPLMEYERKGNRLVAKVMGFGIGALAAYVFTGEPHVHVRADGYNPTNRANTNNVGTWNIPAPTGLSLKLEDGKNVPIIDMSNNRGYGIVGIEYDTNSSSYNVVGAKYDAKSTNAIGTNQLKVLGKGIDSTNNANTNLNYVPSAPKGLRAIITN